jgi:hypothetical protein
MASGLTRYAERELLDHILKTGSYTPPTHIYVGLFTVAPNSQGGGTECPDANYVRQQSDAWDAATDADPAVAQNTNVIEFPAMAASQAIVAIGIFDALNGTNLLAWVTTSFTAGIGIVVHFDAAAIKVRMNYTA